ncbi:hypothetical protein GCM10010469_00160 [Streptomyces labedae]|uniref:STAS domain-containing protein n=1 Tax=Streptomyces labedae TaxID=285569 RepID=A0ABP6QPK8_9ACTN
MHQAPDIAGRAELAGRLEGLVHAHEPALVLIVLAEYAADGPTTSVVLRVHRTCRDLGIRLSVASTSAPVRRLLEAHADTAGTHLVIHARADTAVTAAARYGDLSESRRPRPG